MPRTRTYRDEVMVLRRFDYGEADRVLTLLARQHGKLRAIAKGARRPTSRHSGNLELFVHTQVLLAQGRELDVVTQSNLLAPFRNVREDLVLLAHAHYLAEVTDGLVEPRDPAERPFLLLLTALRALDEGVNPSLLVAHYLLQLLDALGFRPELFSCVACQAPVLPETNHLSVSEGGALCPRCGSGRPQSHPVRADTLKVMRNLSRSAVPGELALSLSDRLAGEVDREARSFVEHHIERRLRSPEFIVRLSRLTDQPTPPSSAQA